MPRVTPSSKELLLEIKSRGHEAVYIRASSLDIYLDGSIRVMHGDRKLELDGGFPRGIGSYVNTELFTKRMSSLRALEISGVTLVNSVKAIESSKDKLVSLMVLARKKIPIPETLVTEDPIDVMKATEKWGEVVIKPIMGSLGLGSTKLDDPDVAYRVAKVITSMGFPVYVQKYIRKPDRDIRVIFVGDDVLGGVYRINKTSWKTNVAQGAITQALVLNQELVELTFKVKDALGLDYAGLDIVEDKDGYKVLEVNASPLWKGFQMATGIKVAKRLVDYLLTKLKR